VGHPDCRHTHTRPHDYDLSVTPPRESAAPASHESCYTRYTQESFVLHRTLFWQGLERETYEIHVAIERTAMYGGGRSGKIIFRFRSKKPLPGTQKYTTHTQTTTVTSNPTSHSHQNNSICLSLGLVCVCVLYCVLHICWYEGKNRTARFSYHPCWNLCLVDTHTLGWIAVVNMRWWWWGVVVVVLRCCLDASHRHRRSSPQ
jgi:hypothetical protein